MASPQKRKYHHQSNIPPGHTIPVHDGFYEAKSILAEDDGKYKIDWATDDEGVKYEPTWEPKSNANHHLVADWKRKKAAAKRRKAPITGVCALKRTPRPSSEGISPEKRPRKGRSRSRSSHWCSLSSNSNPEDRHRDGQDVLLVDSMTALPQSSIGDESYNRCGRKLEQASRDQVFVVLPLKELERDNYIHYSSSSITTHQLLSSPDLDFVTNSSSQHSTFDLVYKDHRTAETGRNDFVPDSQSQSITSEFVHTASLTSCAPTHLLSSPSAIPSNRVDSIASASSTPIVARARHLESLPATHIVRSSIVNDLGRARDRMKLQKSPSSSIYVGARAVIEQVASGRSTASHGASETLWQGAQSDPLAEHSHCLREEGTAVETAVLISKDPNSLREPSYTSSSSCTSHQTRVSQSAYLKVFPPFRIEALQGLLDSPLDLPPRLPSQGEDPVHARASLDISPSETTTTMSQSHMNNSFKASVPVIPDSTGSSGLNIQPLPARSAKSPSVIPETTQLSNVDSRARGFLVSRSEGSSIDPTRVSDIDISADDDHAGLESCEVLELGGSLPSLQPPKQSAAETVVLLAMVERIRDQYQQTLYNYHDAIDAFVRVDGSPNHALETQMRNLLEHLRNVAIHPDLGVDGPLTQQQINPVDEAKWAEESSAKFGFLRRLFDLLRDSSLHVVIAAQQGQVMQVLEVFLEGIGVSFTSQEKPRSLTTANAGPLTTTLLATNSKTTESILGDAAMVVDFDGTFRDCPLLLQSTRPRLQVPTVSLVVANSVEHIDLWLPSTMRKFTRMQALITCAAHSRHEVGKLPVDQPTTSEAAAEIVRCLLAMTSEDRQWSRSNMPEPVGISTQSYLYGARQGILTEKEGDEKGHLLKRPWVEEDGVEMSSSKKPRMMQDSQPPLQPAASDILQPRNSDLGHTLAASDAASSSRIVESNAQGQALRDLGHEQRVGAPITQASESMENVQALEQLHQRAAGADELFRSLRDLESRVRTREEELSRLQGRFEDQCEENRAALKQLDVVRRLTEQLEVRREMQDSALLKLTEVNNRLQSELQEARRRSEGASPADGASLAQAQREVQQAHADQLELRQRLESTSKDFAFSSTQYQVASNAAFEATQELNVLREENNALQRKADGEAVKLRKMNSSAEVERHLERIQELELLLEDREELVKKKDEELRLQVRGKGLTTRASSVPRSPRPYSRASSPSWATVGRTAHPLRQG